MELRIWSEMSHCSSAFGLFKSAWQKLQFSMGSFCQSVKSWPNASARFLSSDSFIALVYYLSKAADAPLKSSQALIKSVANFLTGFGMLRSALTDLISNIPAPLSIRLDLIWRHHVRAVR
jgi:hypothetical protein